MRSYLFLPLSRGLSSWWGESPHTSPVHGSLDWSSQRLPFSSGCSGTSTGNAGRRRKAHRRCIDCRPCESPASSHPRIARWVADTILDDLEKRKRVPTRVQAQPKNTLILLSRKLLRGVRKSSIVTLERITPVEMPSSMLRIPLMRRLKDDGSWGDWVETMPSLRGDLLNC